MDPIYQLAANVRDHFVVYSTFDGMHRFLDTFDRAKGDKPDYLGFGGPSALYQDNLKGLDVNCTNGQVIDDRYAPHVADEIHRSLIDGGVKRPPDVIVDGNRLLSVICFMADLAKRDEEYLPPDMRKRLHIVVDSIPTGPIVTHDLEVAQNIAYS